MTQEEAINRWKVEVYDKAKEIDPDDEIDWGDMAFGYFLAHKFSLEEAHFMAHILLVERRLI